MECLACKRSFYVATDEEYQVLKWLRLVLYILSHFATFSSFCAIWHKMTKMWQNITKYTKPSVTFLKLDSCHPLQHKMKVYTQGIPNPVAFLESGTQSWHYEKKNQCLCKCYKKYYIFMKYEKTRIFEGNIYTEKKISRKKNFFFSIFFLEKRYGSKLWFCKKTKWKQWVMNECSTFYFSKFRFFPIKRRSYLDPLLRAEPRRITGF